MIKKLALNLILLVALISCVPRTKTRRSAFVPTPAPPVTSGRTTPYKKVEIRVAASPLYIGVDNAKLTQVGDAGLFIPHTQFQVALNYGVSKYLDLGLYFAWAPFSTSTISTPGVPPLDDRRDLFGVGPSVRANIPLGRAGLALGLVLEGGYLTIPYSIWQCPTCTNDYNYSSGSYTLKENGRKEMLVFNFAVILNYHWRWLTFFGGFSFSSQIKNVGFDPTLSLESTLQYDSPMPMVLWGVEWDVVERFRLTALAYFPLKRTPVDYYPGVSFGFRVLL